MIGQLALPVSATAAPSGRCRSVAPQTLGGLGGRQISPVERLGSTDSARCKADFLGDGDRTHRHARASDTQTEELKAKITEIACAHGRLGYPA
jgi:hypothetical protein